MLTVKEYFTITESSWRLYWKNKSFRYKLIGCFIFIGLALPFVSSFFQYIEHRKGTLINDKLLLWLPSYDLSIPIFILIWSSIFFMLLTGIKNPDALLKILLSYIFLTIYRFLSIYFVPLDPPVHIIYLSDPLSNFFYGPTFITKDLFFSGHTSTLFLIGLCHHNKFFKYYTFIASLAVGILVMVQHVHYTIDVLFAYPFAYISYRNAKYFINNS